MKNKLKIISIIILGLLILLSTTVLGSSDISSLLEPDEIENVEPITSVSTQITRILGTMASIIIPIILVIAVVVGVIVWAVIYSSKNGNKSQNINDKENEEDANKKENK